MKTNLERLALISNNELVINVRYLIVNGHNPATQINLRSSLLNVLSTNITFIDEEMQLIMEVVPAIQPNGWAKGGGSGTVQ